jgi:hypothetical protein
MSTKTLKVKYFFVDDGARGDYVFVHDNWCKKDTPCAEY